MNHLLPTGKLLPTEKLLTLSIQNLISNKILINSSLKFILSDHNSN